MYPKWFLSLFPNTDLRMRPQPIRGSTPARKAGRRGPGITRAPLGSKETPKKLQKAGRRAARKGMRRR